jgi:HPt (histidine-containing phosphotransfer) domain-containing protein
MRADTFRPRENGSGFDAIGRDGFALGASPVDLVHLARQTMGDCELETELLASFQAQALQIAEKLGDAGASAAVADLASKLKGSARAVGAVAVAAAAENYEHAARAGLLTPSDAERLVSAVAETRAWLGELAS